MQHIIYAEWLPIVLGCENAAKYDLLPKKTGYFNGKLFFIMVNLISFSFCLIILVMEMGK